MISKKTKRISFNLNYAVITILAGLTFVSLLTGIVISFQTNIVIDKKIATEKELARPANIEIVSITDLNCLDCFSLVELVNTIKKQNVAITSEKNLTLNDKESKEFIDKYNITKVPVLIIIGEVSKEIKLKDYLEKIGKIEKDTFVLTQIAYPQVVVASGQVIGRIQVTLLSDKSCAECYPVATHTKILSSFGVSPKSNQSFDIGSEEGNTLVKRYNIKSVPTLVLEGDIDAYPKLKSVWSTVGTVENDGAYIFRDGVPQMGVYKNLASGQIIKPTPPPTPPAPTSAPEIQ